MKVKLLKYFNNEGFEDNYIYLDLLDNLEYRKVNSVILYIWILENGIWDLEEKKRSWERNVYNMRGRYK